MEGSAETSLVGEAGGSSLGKGNGDNALEGAGTEAATLTQRVINCDRGSAAGDRFKVFCKPEYLCIRNFCRHFSWG